MRWSTAYSLCAVAAALVSFGIGGLLEAQDPAGGQNPPAPAPPLVEAKGLPPRAAPADYSAHTQIGKYTLAADFTAHNIGTQEGLLTTEDYVVVEAAMFGPREARLMLSIDDFSLKINGKKPVPRQPYELMIKTVKDPDYEEPASNKEAKTKMTGVGDKTPGADPDLPPAALVPIPFQIKRGWELRVKRDSFPMGDRVLPQAGLLFFSSLARAKDVHSLELVYSGPAGKATLAIHP